MTVDCAVPEFSASTMGASEGCFKIDTDDSFSSNQDEYLIGMAKVGAHGMVCPVAAVRLSPVVRSVMPSTATTADKPTHQVPRHAQPHNLHGPAHEVYGLPDDVPDRRGR